ncbi:MAG: preprotein translocase subunit SecG [Microscillaceae bacterium]|nr:preprotein translocase subunit SecG [Microscillaceae bacterium]
MLYTIIISVVVLVSILLILVVLVQDPKTGGVSSQFGGAGANQVMGTKKTTDLIEKITWSFAGVILVLSLLTNVFIDKTNAGGLPSSPNVERAQEKRTTAPAPVPNQNPQPASGDKKTAPPAEKK